MFDSVVEHIAHHVERQDTFAQEHHSDGSGQSSSVARTARSTGYDPNLIQYESGTHFMSIPDGDGEDLRRVANSQLEEVPSSLSLEYHVLQLARVDPGAIHRAALSECNNGLLWYQCLRC